MIVSTAAASVTPRTELADSAWFMWTVSLPSSASRLADGQVVRAAARPQDRRDAEAVRAIDRGGRAV